MNSIAAILFTLIMKSEAHSPQPRPIEMELEPNPPAPRRRLPRSSFVTKKLISQGGSAEVYRIGTANEFTALKVFNRRKKGRTSLRECARERGILKKIAEYETNRWNGRTLQISHIRKDYPTEVPDQLILEYIAGKDLTEAEFGEYSMPKLVSTIHSMMQQIRDNVLERLHSVNIYHNDIKPANILFDDGTGSSVDPMFYLIDFGNAVDGYEVDRDHWNWCTLDFVSPYLFEIHVNAEMWEEIHQEKLFEAGKKADYYSLALTAIASIKEHCPAKSAKPLCKWAHDLCELQKDWNNHQQKFVTWPPQEIDDLLVPYWTAVAQRISNFRKQNPRMYPKFMKLLAEWTSCEGGFWVCRLIDVRPGARLMKEERRRLASSGFAPAPPSAFIPKKDLISEGGYGKVYRVTTVGQDAVIKVFDKGRNKQKIKNCERERAILEEIASYEAEQGRTLQISHILKVYPAVVSPQLMLEYIPGKDLTKAIFGGYSMPKLVDIIHSMMQQISEDVLEGLHSTYIYHNDIKPANILYVPGRGKPKFYLIDFGLAVDGFAGPAHPRGRWHWCTLRFVSPYLYQIRVDAMMGEEISFEAAKKADYYSLGLTAIDTIRRHCSVKSGDTLCSMAHELFALQKGWNDHAQTFVDWSIPELEDLLVPYWTKVARRISNFRDQYPTQYPEFMRLLATWISCEGFIICEEINLDFQDERIGTE